LDAADGAAVQLVEVTPDPTSPAPAAHAELRELVAAVERLPGRERHMVALHAQGHSVREIADMYRCSEARVSQLLSAARLRLEEATAA
jgi:RNA polymerase sigma factor (sigma-70 family)